MRVVLKMPKKHDFRIFKRYKARINTYIKIIKKTSYQLIKNIRLNPNYVKKSLKKNT
jgi:hypothetical protein